MSTHPTDSQRPNPQDPLLQRYREANAHDGSQPSANLREAVLAHAKARATAPVAPKETQRPAANDNQWTLRALGSIAVLGLVGLLVNQFERGSPDEQHIALGASSQQTERSMAAEQSKAAAPADTSASAASERIAPENESEGVSMSPPKPTPASPPVDADTVAESPATVAKPASPERAAKTEAPDAFEPAESSVAMAPATRAAPTDNADTAPSSKAQTASPAPMASARSAAQPRSTLSETQQRSKREVASENQVSASAGMTSDSVPAPLPPLHAAAIKGDLPATQSLLAQGMDINARDSLGRTALMLAAMGRQKSLLVALMDAGADTTLRDHAGLSAADHALRAGRADWLPLLQPAR